MSSQHFRAGVVIVVRHPDLRQVLVFERADSPGSWQLPQGGLEVGEEPVAAAWRELFEETGLGPDEVEVRAEFPEWVAYEWPPEVRATQRKGTVRMGQVQRWFLFDARSADVRPQPDGSEFTAWQWVERSWVLDHVLDWRRVAYRRVLSTL